MSGTASGGKPDGARAPLPQPSAIPRPTPVPRPTAPASPDAPSIYTTPAGKTPGPVMPRLAPGQFPGAARMAGPATPRPFPAAGRYGAQQPFAASGGSTPGEAGVDAVREALRNKVERVPLSALERRGFKNVQVLDMAAIERIVAEAVTHLLERHTAVMTSEEREKVEAEAKQEFSKLLAEHKKLTVEKSEAQQREELLERQMQGLREELDRQTKQLASEQAALLESTFTLSPTAFVEMEEKIRRLFGKLISEERRASLADAGPGALKGLSSLEREVAAMLDRLLLGERDRFMGSLKKESSEKIGMLEKRIQKLNKALHESEEALSAMAAAKSVDSGIASLYGKEPGLNPNDPNFGRKKELLSEIFAQNERLLRPRKTRAQTMAEEDAKLAASTRAAGSAIEAAKSSAASARRLAPGGAPEAAVPPPTPPPPPKEEPKVNWALASLGFEPPVETVSDEKAF